MVLGSGAFGKYLDHESGALMNGMSVFRKQAPESLWILCHQVRTLWEDTCYEAGGKPSPDTTQTGWHHDLGLSGAKTM